MGFGDAAGSGAIQRLQREVRANQQDRAQRRQERADARRELPAEAAAEPLVCPGCETRYDFGASCPACQVELVGLSMLGKVEATPVVRRMSRAEVVRDVLLVTLAASALAGFWIWFIWGGGAYLFARLY